MPFVAGDRHNEVDVVRRRSGDDGGSWTVAVNHGPGEAMIEVRGYDLVREIEFAGGCVRSRTGGDGTMLASQRQQHMLERVLRAGGVVHTGGRSTPSDALVGPVAVDTLRKLHVDPEAIGTVA